MKVLLIVVLSAVVLMVAVVCMCACRMASEADERMEEMFERKDKGE